MKRRNFNLLAGTSFAALMGPKLKAFAQLAPSNFATLSQTTLTPMGAERAGNAAGTIPAWTGGFTTIPAGWNPESELPPDFFASDSPLYTVNASNVAQYADLLSDGVQAMIQKNGFSIQVYPTHRTAAAPQWVYDNIVQNAGRATLDTRGARLGFSGGYGGIPFPVPDTSDSLAAGAQVMWNHITRWCGTYVSSTEGAGTVSGGVPALSAITNISYYYPYYDPKGSLEHFNGDILYQNITSVYPANNAGEIILVHESVDSLTQPNIMWELQLGLGRVRKAPELAYDTPAPNTHGMSNYDEYYGFYGALDEYDWRLIGKREMLIPYNTNKMCHVTSATTMGPKFVNPDVVRWELHRVWVVDATLHPGKRNVLARRRFYFDEDTWTVMVVDAWDGDGNIYHHEQAFYIVCPQLPGVVYANAVVYNPQTEDYAMIFSKSADKPLNQPFSFNPVPMSLFEPQTIAANSTY